MNKSILYIVISTACFAVVNFLVKFLDTIPTSEIVFFRSVITLVITFSMVLKLGLPVFGNNKKWLLVRGIAGATSLTIFFYTLKEIPMATATTIQYLSPFFTVVIAIYLLNEKVKKIQWFWFAVAFAGVVMIKGFDDRVSWSWLGLGILSAFLSAIAYNAIMKCRNTDHPYTIVMAFPLVAAPVTGIWASTEWVNPVGQEWMIILIIGLFTQVAQVFMIRALNTGTPAVVTPFKYLGVIYALFLGYFFFDETFTALSLMGMGLVLTGVILNSFTKT